METLSKIFGSETKVKVMRLFLFNPDRVYSMTQIAERSKADIGRVRREVSNLEKMGMIKRRTIVKNKVSKLGFVVNPQFSYLSSLQNFLVNVEPLNSKEIIRRISKLGSIKFLVISGVFIQMLESRIDILVVGDNIKKGSLENTIKTLESEIGKELKYAYFSTEDFKYRHGMFDKLIRDILDYPHKKIVNKLGIL